MSTPTTTPDQPSRPRLRLLPAPPIDPPYEDELPPRPPLTDGSLALTFPPPMTDAMPLRLVPPALPRPAAAPGSAPPELGPFVRRLAQALVEVLAGARPAGQFTDYARLDVLEHLERAAGRLVGPDGARQRPIVRSVHVCRPRASVAEVCAVMDTGPRRRAIALRLEVHRGAWECTALQIG
jgi:hypothetical protein